MAFFNSDNVHMFPSAYRIKGTSKYTSEENISNILNSVVDVDSYVLSTKNDLANSQPLRFVLHGYYFEIQGFSLTNYQNFYVAIRVEQGADAIITYDTGSPHDLDVGNEFLGLMYSTSQINPPTDPDNKYKYYTLQISSNGELVNQVRISSDSVFYNTGTEKKTVTDMLDSKQDTLKAGNGINIVSDNTISLTDPYNTAVNSIASKTVGTTSKPVYVDNGVVKAITGNSGTTQKSAGSGTSAYTYVQAALVSSGALQSTGVQLFASENSPDNSVGRNGDFWFKYESSN